MAELLKDVYTQDYISNLAQCVKNEYDKFDEKMFFQEVFNASWESLELKQRMRHIARSLHACLPFEYEKQLKILQPASKDFHSFKGMFFQDFVEVFGLEDFENSMNALEVFTQDCSSEFAVRQFILNYEDLALDRMNQWSKSQNEHLRRLACEGCRPRLPWGVALPAFKKDPSKILEIIEELKWDKAVYVQKSVANNLNDISKDNPHVLIDFVRKNLGQGKSLDWICKHASRTLLKKGNEEILNLFGYEESSHVKVNNFKWDEHVHMGEDLHFSFDLDACTLLGKLRIEYAIYYLKANGSLSKKVFMLSQSDFELQSKTFKTKQSFKNMTTRKHYVGTHAVAIIINGKEMIKKEFFLHDTRN